MNQYTIPLELLKNYIPLATEIEQLQALRDQVKRDWAFLRMRPGETGQHLIDLYTERIAQATRTRSSIAACVDTLPDGIEKNLLRGHFLDGCTWEQLAEEYCYSNTQLFRYRKKALEQFEIQIQNIGVNNHA